jgi:VanZ family protein
MLHPTLTTLFRIAFGCCIAIVLYYAVAPTLPPQMEGQDKYAHMLAFAALGLTGGMGWPRHWWTLNLGLLALGGAIELVQWTTPSRVADAGDLLSNVVGQALGVAGARLLLAAAGVKA